MKTTLPNYFLSAITCLLLSCESNYNGSDYESYKSVSRLTDPEGNSLLLKHLPNDIIDICNIANVQLVHYRMLSQWKIPRSNWNTKFANHDFKDILDTLKASGDGNLNIYRNLKNRIIGACTKESIFSTGLLRSKGIPARIRVGYLTNLYRADSTLKFWKNVKEFEWQDTTGEFPDDFTRRAIEVNRSIEHWITEYWDSGMASWRLLDIRPEYINAYGKNVDYFLEENSDFEFAWQVWKRINDTDFHEEAYAEGDLDAKSHVRYQLLMDFYSLLNHESPGVFDSNGRFIGDSGNKEIEFLKKNYSDLSSEEIAELNALADLLSRNPESHDLVLFYVNSKTLKIESIEKDEYSFVYKYLHSDYQ